MKKYITTCLFLLSTIVLVLITSSCKKGPDDPAFTLISRKARLAGNWKLQAAEISIGIKDSSGAADVLKYTLTGDSYHLDDNSNGSHFDGPASMSLSFAKKGTFTLDQNMGNGYITASGNWDFLLKGKGYKNKERVSLAITSSTGDSQQLYMLNMSLINFDYVIKELKSKKLVLSASQEELAANEDGLTAYITAEYTFTQ